MNSGRKLTDQEVIDTALAMPKIVDPTTALIKTLAAKYGVSEREAGRAYSRVVEHDLIHQVWETYRGRFDAVCHWETSRPVPSAPLSGNDGNAL